MKFIPRKFVTVLVSLVALGATTLATSPVQAEPSTAAAPKAQKLPKVAEHQGGPMRILVHGAW